MFEATILSLWTVMIFVLFVVNLVRHSRKHAVEKSKQHFSSMFLALFALLVVNQAFWSVMIQGKKEAEIIDS